MANESTQWRKFLQPVVTGLVALMAAGVGYLQYLQKQDGNKLESRVTVLEVQSATLQPWRARVDGDLDNFKVLLSDIRSDVSFIRGKMEVGNGVGFGK